MRRPQPLRALAGPPAPLLGAAEIRTDTSPLTPNGATWVDSAIDWRVRNGRGRRY